MGFDQFWISPPEFLELQERTRAFSVVGAFTTGQANLTAPDRPRRVNAVPASAELFTALGVNALYGRTFEAAETRPNGAPVTILSYELWQSSFGGDPKPSDRRSKINGVRRTVVGIMPPHFDVADRHVEVWNPLVLDPANRQNRGSHYLYLIGRLADGVDAAAATGRARHAARRLARVDCACGDRDQRSAHAGHRRIIGCGSIRCRRRSSAAPSTAVLVLQGAVFSCCSSPARTWRTCCWRAPSRGTRNSPSARALGAGRWRLLRQFMVEGCLLSFAGAALGLGVAVAGVRALIAAYPDSLPRSADVALDLGVLAFTLSSASPPVRSSVSRRCCTWRPTRRRWR